MLSWQDVRYAVRLLVRTPGQSFLTVLVLAGGLGVAIFTFAFLDAAILRPLPVGDGAGIVRLGEIVDQPTGLVDAADLAAIRGQITSLTEVGAYTGRDLVVGTGQGVRSLAAAATEWNLFELTRTRPFLGRGFRPDDQRRGAEPVIVLGYRAWERDFAADRGIVDRLVTIDGTPTRVIGVMPRGYGFPVAAEAWVPIRPDLLTATVPDQDRVEVYARLAAGRSRSQAAAELTALVAEARRSFPPPAEPSEVAPTGVTVETFPMAQIGEEAPLVLVVLDLIAVLILLLACVNVTNLLVARANERVRETAVRLALGAPRARLVMQALWETILLSVAGGVLATLVAVAGLRGVNAWAWSRLEGNLPFWWVWGYDSSVLLGAGAFVTLAVAVLGTVVARRAVSVEIASVLQEGGARTGGRREGRVARALVVAQVATVSVLMFFGSLSALIAYRVAHVDLGYDTRDLLASGVELPPERYPGPGERTRFFAAVLDRLGARSEIDGAGLRSELAQITSDRGEVELADQPGLAPRPRAFVIAAQGGLGPMGVALDLGRSFDARDAAGTPGAAIVSEAFARRHWPGRPALGERIRLAGQGETAWRTVVGVAGDVLLGNPFSRDRSAVAVYVPLEQTAVTGARILFRHRGDRVAAQAAFQEAVAGVDPLIVPVGVSSYDEILAKSGQIAKSVTLLFGLCFGFALLLAVTGTYGLMARAIGRRTREIGIRRALGATDRTILALLLGQGGRQLGVGAVAALPLMAAVGWGFSRYFPVALPVTLLAAVLVSAAITGVVLAATWVPTRRAIAVQPAQALWRE